MTRTFGKGPVLLAMMIGASMLLSGCGGFRDAFGISKRPPDEFTVVAKSPLVVPPEFNLRPPATGERPAREAPPQQMALDAMFPGSSDAARASVVEDSIVRSAGASDADGDIRSSVSEDSNTVRKGTFTETILFDESLEDGESPAE